MTDIQSSIRSAPRVAPYWIAIALILLTAVGIFLFHQISGTAPSSVAFHIEAIDFNIYWYGIWIVGGIAIGCWVVSALASERARQIFALTVPETIRRQPLEFLNLPQDLQQKAEKKDVETAGEFLYLWGFDPRLLGLSRKEIPLAYEALAAQPEIDASWLDDAPWRVWNPEHVWNGIVWALIFGIIGARLYHVLTPSPSMAALGIESPLDYFQHPYQLINLRAGGLGIFGGIAGGALGLYIYSRRARIPVLGWADLAVVGLALGQAIGRWGNYFNQELYGRPTELPWAIQIDHPLAEYAAFDRFHPAFLYESIWSFFTFLLLFFLTKRYAQEFLPGELTAIYLILYAVGRSLLEMIRLDSRTVSFGAIDSGLAIATLVSIIIALLSALFVVVRRSRSNRHLDAAS